VARGLTTRSISTAPNYRVLRAERAHSQTRTLIMAEWYTIGEIVTGEAGVKVKKISQGDPEWEYACVGLWQDHQSGFLHGGG
jgi:hypothetical protein